MGDFAPFESDSSLGSDLETAVSASFVWSSGQGGSTFLVVSQRFIGGKQRRGNIAQKFRPGGLEFGDLFFDDFGKVEEFFKFSPQIFDFGIVGKFYFCASSSSAARIRSSASPIFFLLSSMALSMA